MTKKLRNYYVDGFQSWYIVKAYNVTQARANGEREFGRMFKSVRRATAPEVESYIFEKGEIETASE